MTKEGRSGPGLERKENTPKRNIVRVRGLGGEWALGRL